MLPDMRVMNLNSDTVPGAIAGTVCIIALFGQFQ